MYKKGHASAHGLQLKKQFGQHFLRDQSVVDAMLAGVSLNAQSSIMEIGCGDGFLTKDLQQQPHARVRIFEIDPEWAEYVATTYPHERMEIVQQDILTIDFETLREHAPWTLLANLPYQITFPLFTKIQEHRDLFGESVVMIQEEVAQKFVATSGRTYSFVSVYFQHYFEFKLLKKVPPTSFVPAPRVTSRLLWFKPRAQLDVIEQEEKFWKLLKVCFHQPRRTIKNNLMQLQMDLSAIPAELLVLRAQQMTKEQFLQLWLLINTEPLITCNHKLFCNRLD
ncbi:MAG: Ribosomal RNA small subunit methyltransferase A [candidate division TM6 bacterium GW2011_GWE2_41_16]|nr:MAG: Ribosomal RNA small subunit methyltransferase A [candidate division TM6 bacterium GW2011_GWE2_41_16]